MRFVALLPLAIGILPVFAQSPTKTRRQSSTNDQFVQTKNSKFLVNGSEFRFVGTNAYWLSALNTEEDIITTFESMSAAGITAVRTWAFNDVDVIPENGTWFQLVANGTTTINNGTNGLAKLDAVVRQAENFGIYLMLTLTNNWNPRPLFDNLTESLQNLTSTVESGGGVSRRDVTVGTNNSLPRNTLSNDYGGMDLYLRQFGLINHDDFYTNSTIIGAFTDWTSNVVSRYVDSPAILAWEIANDPRCNSSIGASPGCNTQTITNWLHNISTHIRSIDSNHLISSGAQGFMCATCPKLFPTPAPPRTSPAAGARRSVPLTQAKIFKERKERRKKRREIARAAAPKSGKRIRGKWSAPETKRQSVEETPGQGSAFDGSQGVDSADIINIPQISFGTFQLFPDQNVYGLDDPNLSAFNNTVENGIDWIRQQAAISQLFGKPITLTGFGLVTQANSPFYVPFNTSVAPFGPDSGANSTGTLAPFGVTDQQRDDAYRQWLDAGIAAGLQGILQYQWSQDNLTGIQGSTIQPDQNATTVSQNQNTTGISPNDGYSIQGVGNADVQGVITNAAQQIKNAEGGSG
ncbi:glycoside hydrolase family 5 protein [Mycena floridula]|nr:glycoside hydrolase family 5 protein [Mycena floridula]